MIEYSEMVARDGAGNELRMVRARASTPGSSAPEVDPHQPYNLNPLAYDPRDGVTVSEVSLFVVDVALEWIAAGTAAAARLVVGILRIVVLSIVWPIVREASCLVLVPSCYALAIVARDCAAFLMDKGLSAHRSSRLLAASLQRAQSTPTAGIERL